MGDALTSLALGVISQTQKLVIFSFAVIAYGWVSEALEITQLSSDDLWVWIFSFVLYDFLYYWAHRFSHQINFLWASHVVHHQSEEYNLTTALRQTSSSVMIWVFYIPSFIIGIPAEVFFVSGALNLIYQYWVHTQLIGKLGWYESIFVTPSHHRVHHAQNQIYIDKNHGGVFILWDKLFGSYQEELDEHQVIYGVRRPVKSYNPIWSNVHTWLSLLTDAIRTKNWWDKIRIWFMPTGWRPSDVEAKYPLIKQAAGAQIKYSPKSSNKLKFYALFQYIACIIFGVVFVQFSIQLENSLQFTFWVLVTVPLLTNGFALEGRRDLLLYSEVIRLILTSIIVFSNQDSLSEHLNTLILVYLALSVIAMIAASRKKKDKKIPLAS
jgi:alkylglycerol monooxygenase